MATLLLTAVGSLIGGPIGGALGALAGRSIDGAIIGSPKREAPRLKELAVTTSSYGQPIPRQHGRMRAAGTIIWATDLVEHKDKQGGKKGQPSITTYAYSTSFAVALSSRPILGVGRIWADGNLLRGEAGDLKAAGIMRIHTGRGDQTPDPLIAAAHGADCPAFRDCAYAVFEDLALETFGNRIPALSFEVIADDGAITLAELVGPLGGGATGALAPLAGFANEGGPLASTLNTVATLFPLTVEAGGERLTIDPVALPLGLPSLLPQPARAWEEDDFGAGEGQRHDRDAAQREHIEAVRYYDVARDFQPGLQRPTGRTPEGAQRTIEFPGALAADDARVLAESAARRTSWGRETLQWRVAELDPALSPGSDVRVPGKAGLWRIESWEWRERGVELALVRRNPAEIAAPAGDPGAVMPPADLPRASTVLLAFDIPPSATAADEPTLFAAATGGRGWNGAALYAERAGELLPLGQSVRSKTTIGYLAQPLPPSPAMLFEPDAALELALAGEGRAFAPASLAALLMGANRLLVGGEVLQFAAAEQTGAETWRLSGLLRGRGGTEPAAQAGHQVGAAAVLIDDALVALDPAMVPADAATTIAAIGLGDDVPVYAVLANAGLGRKPPAPVHARSTEVADGALLLQWTRRARGAWGWLDGVDTPLVEEREAYRVGLGPVEAPFAEWKVSEPEMRLDGATRAALAAAYPGTSLWVRQIGQFAQSDALFLGQVA
jgi:hypothetical protein